MNSKQRGIEETIRRAIAAGEFDDLLGMGKPLDLSDNPYADPTWRLAYHLLKQNGFAPPWVETRQEIEKALSQARESLVRTYRWREKALAAGEQPGFVAMESKLRG